MKEEKRINVFSDQDLYSWSVCLFYLNHFPEASLTYKFIDRNNTVYPEGFADRLNREIWRMDGLRMSSKEIEVLRGFTSAYFPGWFYTFLVGLELESKEVKFNQTPDGKLEGEITGPAWRVVFWEQILLSLVSEMWHEEIGDDALYNIDTESAETISKGEELLKAGVAFVDMGTRRRFSQEHHCRVVEDLAELQDKNKEAGRFIGTSNLWLAGKLKEKYPWIKCVGTMSHQVISICAAIYGPREANKIAMEKWYESYRGNLGCYLPDCLGSKAFFSNFSKENAKLWDSYRIDSGDNVAEFEAIEKKLKEFSVNPTERGIVFSNGLKTKDAIDLHNVVAGRMIDTYGIGTTLTCGMDEKRIKPLNIVIKATAVQLTPRTEWLNCVKLSCDTGKATGDPKTVEAYKTLLGI